jgi:hypothetical protein
MRLFQNMTVLPQSPSYFLYYVVGHAAGRLIPLAFSLYHAASIGHFGWNR